MPTKEELRQRNKDYYQANKERILKQQREWRKANPEKVKAAREKWKKANPGKVKESHKKYREKIKDIIKTFEKKKVTKGDIKDYPEELNNLIERLADFLKKNGINLNEAAGKIYDSYNIKVHIKQYNNVHKDIKKIAEKYGKKKRAVAIDIFQGLKSKSKK